MNLSNLIDDVLLGQSSCLHSLNGTAIASADVANAFQHLVSYLEMNTQAGDTVAIRLEQGPRYLLAIYACMRMGRAFVPLKTSWPEQRISQIQSIAHFKLILNDETYQKAVQTSVVHPIPVPLLSPEGPLYIIFTSGTTGEPKGVVVSRAAYESFLEGLQQGLSQIPDGLRELVVADFTFDMSFLDVALFLLKKTSLFFSQFGTNVFKLAHEVESFRIEIFVSVPNNITMLLRSELKERTDLSSLRYLLLGGARFAYGTYRAILEGLPSARVYNFYGPTEATVYSHFEKLKLDEEKDLLESNVTVGKPMGKMQGLVMKPDGTAVQREFEQGEIWLAGPQLFTQYLNDPIRTEQATGFFSGERFYRTGDLGFFDSRGRLYIDGRLDETIKHRGYRINLLDIDGYIQKISGVRDSLTVARNLEDGDSRLVTYLILDESVELSAVRDQMAQTLLTYQIPDDIRSVKAFPTNASGKICRKTLASDSDRN